MVIVGGSKQSWSYIRWFLIWFFWVESEPLGLFMIDFLTSYLPNDSILKIHLLESAAHMRLIMMGLILMLTTFCTQGDYRRAKKIMKLLKISITILLFIFNCKILSAEVRKFLLKITKF